MYEVEIRSEGLELQERYAYYRRCQVVMRNGQQCRCPAQKGSDSCRNHADQRKRLENRRAAQGAVLRAATERMASRTGRKHTAEDVLRSPGGIIVALDELGQALIEGRLDERGAREMLAELQSALWGKGFELARIRLNSPVSLRPGEGA